MPSLKTFSEFRPHQNKPGSSELSEGGAFGHLQHIYDVPTFQFSDLKDLISKAFTGNLEWTRAKTDGHNLMVTFNGDKLIASRNKGHLKNFGATALDARAIKSKFKGRDIEDSFYYTMVDLEKAVKGLSKKQQEKIFKKGEAWLSLEIMTPQTKNVVDYGSAWQVRFHGTLEHDTDGNITGQLNKKAGQMLDGMLRQKNLERQSKFTLSKIDKLKLDKVSNYSANVSKFHSRIDKIASSAGLSSNNTISEFIKNIFEKEIDKIDSKKELDVGTRNQFIQRMAFSDKSIKIVHLQKEFPESIRDQLKALDKNAGTVYKKAMIPFDELAGDAGQLVASTLTDFMGANPSKAIADIRKRIEDVVEKIGASDNEAAKSKLKINLERLQKLGGMDAIIPSEGITFLYKGELLKLTGSFASVNQILGLLYSI